MKSAASKKKDDDFEDESYSLEVEKDRQNEVPVQKSHHDAGSALATSDDPDYFDIA